LEQLESKLQTIEQFQSKLQQLETTMLDDINSRQAEIQNHVKKEFEHHKLKEQQLKESKRVEKLKQELYTILKSNNQLTKQTKQSQYISFELENLPGVKMECPPWGHYSLYDLFYSRLVDIYLPHHLNPLKATIEQSKLFISSKSVLDGDWIQIRGDGAVLDMNKETVYSFIKPGDESIPYTGCDQNCWNCKGKGFDGHRTQLRHVIKFKWE
jgi:glycerophosphoryl diester phosphodiesterase